MDPNSGFTSTTEAELTAVFKYDKESHDEYQRQMEAAQEEQRRRQREFQLLADTEYEYGRQLRIQKTKEALDEQREVLTRGWQEIIAKYKEGTAEYIQATKAFESDLEKHAAKVAEFQGKVEGGGAVRSSSSDSILNKLQPNNYDLLGGNFSQFMSLAGLGSILAAGSLFGISSELMAMSGRTREARAVATQFGAEVGGVPEGFFPGLSDTVKRLEENFDVSKPAQMGILSQLAPIARLNEGSNDIGRLLDFSVKFGAAAGIRPADIASMMTRMVVQEDTPLENVQGRVFDMTRQARRINMNPGDFVDMVDTLVETGKRYNLSIDEATNIVRVFGRELYEGTLSMREVSQARNAVAQAPEGMQAFLAQSALQHGGPVADAMRAAGATDTIGGMTFVQATSQGLLFDPGRGFVKPTTPEEHQRLNELRGGLQRLALSTVHDYTRGMGPLQSAFYRTRLLGSMFGMNVGIGALRSTEMIMGSGTYPEPDARAMAWAGAGQAGVNLDSPWALEAMVSQGEDNLWNQRSQSSRVGSFTKGMWDTVPFMPDVGPGGLFAGLRALHWALKLPGNLANSYYEETKGAPINILVEPSKRTPVDAKVYPDSTFERPRLGRGNY